MKPDSNFISYVVPNYVYGRRQGLTDEETEKLAEEAYSLMQISEEKQVAKKPVIAESAPSYVLGKKVYTGYKACGVCGDVVGGGCAEKSNYCSECGNKVDWSEE